MERLHTCTNYSPDNMGLLDPATSDGRVIFFLPWEKMTIAGTTDTPTEVTAHPIPLEDDINFILSEVRNYLSPEVEGNTTLSMLFSFEKFSNEMLPHLERKENWKSYKGIIWPAKKNIIWCIAMHLCGLRLKKHIIFHIMYTIVAPLCPALSKRVDFYKAQKRGVLLLASYPVRDWPNTSSVRRKCCAPYRIVMLFPSATTQK